MKHRAQWLADGTFGVMVHYLFAPKGDTPEARTADFNRIVDSFDLDYFMDQFTRTGADWLIFTIGQNTGYYNAPNAFLDRVLPGHTSRRDLVSDVARSIKGTGKRFIAYLPCEVAGQKSDVPEAFGWSADDKSEFLKRYLEFVRDYSLQLGRLEDGWWYDGAYDHLHEGKWSWQDWIDASRAGNPDSIIAFNDGAFCCGREKPVTPLQDYHAGEVHLIEDGKIRFDFFPSEDDIVLTEDGRLRQKGREPEFYMPTSQCVDGVQQHALIPLDLTFNPAITSKYLHYTDEEVLSVARGFKAAGGGVTFNVPIEENGHIAQSSAEQLVRIGKQLV